VTDSSRGPLRIRLRNVSLERIIHHEDSRDLKRSIFTLVRRSYRKPERRQVLRSVSLDVYGGERVGVIGENGAGKSTLLKVIAGIVHPTGEVDIRGSVAGLIELGAGFEPDLSLYDNVLMYGVLLGLTRNEMRARAERILQFAELDDLRGTLAKTLSTGMLARLGFAVATDVEPDILLIDEVLSVGDERFREKSKARIESLWRHGTASLIVTHDLDFIERECDRVICMNRGRIAFSGNPRSGVQFYRDIILHSPGHVREGAN
jgi:ABC-type polysaccharide/polyol phosphate transport system ATPase subunit